MSQDAGTSVDRRQTVTAIFDDRGAAEKAKADLIRSGFAEADIAFVEAPAAANAHAEAHKENIFTSLLNIFVFMPGEDRSSYAEGVRRGGVALAVHTDASGYEQAIDILDRDGAVDLDERESSWRSGGWTAAPAVSAGDDRSAFAAENRHDPLVNPGANRDVRERIGTGTSDMTVGTDIAPGSAVSDGASDEPVRTAIPGEDEQSVTSRRDTSHGRRRIRSYIGSAGGMPTGVDPQI